MKITAINSINTVRTASASKWGAVSGDAISMQNRISDKSISFLGNSAKNLFIASQNISKIQDFVRLNPDIHVNIISGFSGSGKDTLLKKFLEKHPEYKLSVSYTTRQIRPGEIDGRDYNFISEEEFQKGIENNEFLEWGVFSGNKYGTKKQTLEQMLGNKENIILKLDTAGALKIKRMIPNAKLIFIKPPSLEELATRLKNRGTESKEDIERRLKAAEQEMEDSKLYDYTVINDENDKAVAKLEEYLVLN